MFSDGVFGTAITLLVLKIQVPEVEEGHTLSEALFGLWPSYLAYACASWSSARCGLTTTTGSATSRATDHVLLFLNTLLLLFVTFIPLPTALLAEHVLGSDEERMTAVVLYSGTLPVTAVFFTLLWLYVFTKHRLW